MFSHVFTQYYVINYLHQERCILLSPAYDQEHTWQG